MNRANTKKAENSRNGNCQQEGVVHTHGLAGVQSVGAMQAEIGILPISYSNLMERIVERGNTKKALRRVEENKGAPGVDGMGIGNLKPYLKEHWEATKNSLLNGTYEPRPVRRVEIPKPDGGTRLLGIPTVLDRLIQQATLQVLTPIYDPTFSDHSYGFRPNRSAKGAVKRAKHYINEGRRIVVDIDLEKFFDRVNHDRLLSMLKQTIADDRLVKLIRRYLKAGVMLNGCCMATDEGTPQGGPLSPLLANIVLHELDEELEKRKHCFVRYADDFNIYVKSKRAGARVMESITGFVEERLKLKVNGSKSAVAQPWQRKFLGFSFTSEKETRVRIAPKSIERFKERVRQLTKRSVGISLTERIERLNKYLVGWCGYFGFIQTPSIFEELEGWLHRRMRMCLLKHWKRPKTTKRNLVARGLSAAWATNISGSGKGWWRLAATHQMHTAFGKKYWKQQGLASIVERYKGLAHA